MARAVYRVQVRRVLQGSETVKRRRLRRKQASPTAPTETPSPHTAQATPEARPRASAKRRPRPSDRVALGQIEKSYGKGSIMRLDEDAYLAIPGISTGALSLDLALGGRGIPKGRIVEIFGPEARVRPRSR
jgi:hypothetical protein